MGCIFSIGNLIHSVREKASQNILTLAGYTEKKNGLAECMNITLLIKKFIMK